MNTDEFWHTLTLAAYSSEPLADSVATVLSTRPPEEILAFEYCFEELRNAVHRWDVWAAAYLIGGGCSDDRFSDFTAGLVALGRDWYQRAAACPDTLAEHPAVQAAAAADDQDVVFAEDFNFVAATAYRQRGDGDEDDFWQAWDTYRKTRTAAQTTTAGDAMGAPFDFDDVQQMRQHLPRLTALYLGPEPH